MRDPFSWSFSLGRLFGVSVRIHIFFPVIAAALVLRAAFAKDADPRVWVDASVVVLMLFVAVLLHEFGHCLGARLVDGDASEVLLWPLGGLASVEVPHTWGAHLITAAAGPLANVALCVISAISFLLMCHFEYLPPLSPFWAPFYIDLPGTISLHRWHGAEELLSAWRPDAFVARFFWVNWIL